MKRNQPLKKFFNAYMHSASQKERRFVKNSPIFTKTMYSGYIDLQKNAAF